MESTLENKARKFATEKHATQFRKYTGLPYVTHCAEVAGIVRDAGGTEDMIAAAWLHDIVEDCAVAVSDVEKEFGQPVSTLVSWLTDVSRREDGNRAIRRAIDRAHSAQAIPNAKTIKLADLISNAETIVHCNPEFARTFLQEGHELLTVLKEGDQVLWKRASDVVESGLYHLDAMEWKAIYEKVTTDPRYLANIQYGKPRRGHAEGSVSSHIGDLDQNLEEMVNRRLVSFDSPTYWKLKVLIHVHDSFKAEAKHDSPILDPRSHASLARAYLEGFTRDEDMLRITQFHDIGFAVYQKLQATGRFDETKLMTGLEGITNLDLFLLFAIIDACTPSKGRRMIRWFVEEVNKRFPSTTIRPEHVLPGPDLVGEVW